MNSIGECRIVSTTYSMKYRIKKLQAHACVEELMEIEMYEYDHSGDFNAHLSPTLVF
jgi:hypothetical protein